MLQLFGDLHNKVVNMITNVVSRGPQGSKPNLNPQVLQRLAVGRQDLDEALIIGYPVYGCVIECRLVCR